MNAVEKESHAPIKFVHSLNRDTLDATRDVAPLSARQRFPRPHVCTCSDLHRTHSLHGTSHDPLLSAALLHDCTFNFFFKKRTARPHCSLTTRRMCLWHVKAVGSGRLAAAEWEERTGSDG